MELIRRDGCGNADENFCPGCYVLGRTPLYRCQECKGDVLYCSECCISRHVENPLHVIFVNALSCNISAEDSNDELVLE